MATKIPHTIAETRHSQKKKRKVNEELHNGNIGLLSPESTNSLGIIKNKTTGLYNDVLQ